MEQVNAELKLEVKTTTESLILCLNETRIFLSLNPISPYNLDVRPLIANS